MSFFKQHGVEGSRLGDKPTPRKDVRPTTVSVEMPAMARSVRGHEVFRQYTIDIRTSYECDHQRVRSVLEQYARVLHANLDGWNIPSKIVVYGSDFFTGYEEIASHVPTVPFETSEFARTTG